MQKLDPLIIVEALRANESRGKVGNELGRNEVRTVSILPPIPNEIRPWKGYYGMPLRGGTALIKVRGVYLTFFHSILMFQFPYKIRTYLMGAMTFCAKPPFQPLTMSAVPIVHQSWYDGAWINIRLDYCVFPIGMAMSEEEKGKEGEYLWLTMGRQDKDGVLVKIHIDELLHSMDRIPGASCDGNSSYSGNSTTLL